jgi:hypothetical protein
MKIEIDERVVTALKVSALIVVGIVGFFMSLGLAILFFTNGHPFYGLLVASGALFAITFPIVYSEI